jgi:hypothetical protein
VLPSWQTQEGGATRFGELCWGGLEVFDDFLRNDVGIGEVGAVFERLILQPEPNRWEASRQSARSAGRQPD